MNYDAEIKARIKSIADEIERQIEFLANEQETAEANHAEWDGEDEAENGDEPEVPDNDDAIGRLGQCLEHLDDALAVLDP